MNYITVLCPHSVESLTDTYYTDHHADCDICRADEQADVVQAENDTCAISLTAVVKTCCGHIFHEACLHVWLRSQFNAFTDGTCPKCRAVLIDVHSREPLVMLDRYAADVENEAAEIRAETLLLRQHNEQLLLQLQEVEEAMVRRLLQREAEGN